MIFHQRELYLTLTIHVFSIGDVWSRGVYTETVNKAGYYPGQGLLPRVLTSLLGSESRCIGQPWHNCMRRE